MDATEVPCSLIKEIHEEGGVHMRGEVSSGLKLSEIREMVPGIHVSEEQGKQIKEEGWFWLDHTETQEELT